MTAVPSFFAKYQSLVEAELGRIVNARGSESGSRDPEAGATDRSAGDGVTRGMAYTVLAPSKRVRAVLTLLSAELCGGAPLAGVPAAAAIELVHASSLILDDLPAMDDAPLRRGVKANHLAHGEAIAILAAFGLLNLAYGTLTRAYEAPLAARLCGLLSDAVGTDGLIAGQAEDLLATDRPIGFEVLERIHRRKTGALFGAAATSGAILAGGAADAVASLTAYAKNLGLAFQIVDDLLDVEGDPVQTGKVIREDVKKTTFVSFSGVAGARQLAAELCQTADRALVPFGPRGDRLRELSAFVARRSW